MGKHDREDTVERHDDHRRDREDFLAVPEDQPAPRPAAPPPARRRRRVLPLALVGAAVLVGGALAGAATLGQRQSPPSEGAPVAATTTPTPVAPAAPATPSPGTGPSPDGAATATPDPAAPAGDPGPDERGDQPGWFGLGGLLRDGADHDGADHQGDHDDGDHLVGVLTSVDAASVVVDAASGQQRLTVGAGTEVVRDHEHASTVDLAVGQEVLVRVSPSGGAADLVVVDPSADDR